MPRYKFIDLFAGIGGFRTAFTNKGFDCVFSSEIDAETQGIASLHKNPGSRQRVPPFLNPD